MQRIKLLVWLVHQSVTKNKPARSLEIKIDRNRRQMDRQKSSERERERQEKHR